MNPLSTTVTFSSETAPSSTSCKESFVNLEQEEISADSETVDMNQIYRMWQRAIDDISAGLYKSSSCPIGFEGTKVLIWFDFYAYPSSKELEYELTTNIGQIELPEIVSVTKDKDVVFTLTNTYDLGFFPNEVSVFWQTPCYIQDSFQVNQPAYRIEDACLRLSEEVFGVARVTADAFARKYRLNIVIDKLTDKVSGLSPVITVAWKNSNDETETNQLSLKVPKCVEHALNLCGGVIGLKHCQNRALPYIVYYSTCDGSVVQVRGQDPESWCLEYPL